VTSKNIRPPTNQDPRSADPEPAAIRVIVLNFNGGHHVVETVESLRQSQVSVPIHLRVVDNTSTDGSDSDLESHFPDLDLHRFGENRGYAGGNNRAIRETNEPFVLLVNHDVVVDPMTVDRLYLALTSGPDRAAVMPRLLFVDPPGTINLIGIGLEANGSPRGMGRGCPDGPEFDTPREIFGAHGACVMYRRSAIEEAGLFDERYFAYNEEFDLAWRLRLLGYTCHYVADARACHHEAISLRKDPNRLLILMERNRIWTLFKNAGIGFLVRNLVPILWQEWAAVRHALGMRTGAPLVARWQALLGLPGILATRWRVQRSRRVTDQEIESWIGRD